MLYVDSKQRRMSDAYQSINKYKLQYFCLWRAIKSGCNNYLSSCSIFYSFLLLSRHRLKLLNIKIVHSYMDQPQPLFVYLR